MTDNTDEIIPVVFSPGQILFRENEQSYHFYIIQEGRVEVFKTAPNGTKVVLAVVAEGTSIGEFAMIDRHPRSATAQAIDEVRAVKVSEAAYEKLLNDLPDWAVAVMKALVERLRQTNEIIRKSQVTETVKREIENVEYDTNASAVKDEFDDDDTPDLT